MKSRKSKPSNIAKFIRIKLIEKGEIQENIAYLLNLSKSTVSYKMKNSAFTYLELVKIFKYLGATDEEIAKAMRG